MGGAHGHVWSENLEHEGETATQTQAYGYDVYAM